MHTLLAITALFLAPVPPAPPAPATAEQICPVVGQIVQSSRETPAFVSIQRALNEREDVIPGFPPRTCAVVPGRSIRCRNTNPGWDDWLVIEACPGVMLAAGSQSFREQQRAGQRDLRRTHFVADLRISYGIDCVICAHPGIRVLEVSFAARGPGRD
jgi:hypothetical protein